MYPFQEKVVLVSPTRKQSKLFYVHVNRGLMLKELCLRYWSIGCSSQYRRQHWVSYKLASNVFVKHRRNIAFTKVWDERDDQLAVVFFSLGVVSSGSDRGSRGSAP